jgi:hypothetical protein
VASLKPIVRAVFDRMTWRVLWRLLQVRRALRRNFAEAIAPVPLGQGHRGERLGDSCREAESLARLVFAVGRRLPGSRCLEQAITLAELLRAQGYPAELAMGARRQHAFAAHAWVECDGKIFDPEPGNVPRFTRLL